METQQSENGYDPQFVRNMIESFLRIGLLLLLLIWTYDIIKPFTVPILWGAIIAMAAFPLVKWLQPKLGNKRGLTASLVSLVLILLLVVPTWSVTDSLLGGLKNLAATMDAGELAVPPPPATVADWPVIGERVFEGWSAANANLEAVLKKSAPQIKALSASLFKKLGSSLMGVLMFVVSLIIAGGFMAYAESCGEAAHRFFVRVGGLKPGGEWATLVVATVRSVLQGVVGVAIIQAALCAVGLVVMGIPGAPIWSAVILFFAIAQLPALIVAAPIIGYAFTAYDTTSASIFAVWMVLAAASDNVLKPMLMGRGLDIPMPVILIGAIGGMIASGIVGLFAGAVVLSIWYKLFSEWLAQEAR
jgi:predicted PurR-regulated permease PerM